MEKVLLTAEEAAEVLNVSRHTVFDLMRTRSLHSVKIGRSRRIPVEAVHSFVASLSQEGP